MYKMRSRALLQIVLNAQECNKTCMLCLKKNEDFVYIYDTFKIEDQNMSIDITISSAMNEMFGIDLSTHIFNQVCDKCTTMILHIYTILRRFHATNTLIKSMIENLHREVLSKINKPLLKTKKCTIKLNVPLRNINNKLTCHKVHKAACETNNCLPPAILKTHSNESQRKCTELQETELNTPTSNRTIYKCSNCNYESTNKKSLEAHVNKIHLFIRPYACQICHKGFYKKSNLVDHGTVHSRSKNATCEKCGDSFVNKKCLREHLRLHTGEKPYECEICLTKFVSASRRSDHVKRKHGDKLETCVICQKKFSLRKDLNRHTRQIHLKG